MNAFGLVVTIVVMLAIVVAILLFEKKRAKQIERDLGDMACEQRRGPTDE